VIHWLVTGISGRFASDGDNGSGSSHPICLHWHNFQLILKTCISSKQKIGVGFNFGFIFLTFGLYQD
jgi:hypothetical protein